MLYKTQVRELKEEVDEKTKACVDLETKHKALELEKYGVFYCHSATDFLICFDQYGKSSVAKYVFTSVLLLVFLFEWGVPFSVAKNYVTTVRNNVESDFVAGTR